MRSLARVTGPALEPLTVPEVEGHLRLDPSGYETAPTAPTVALADAGAGNVDTGVHRYRLTFVTCDGETEGGAISAALTVVDRTTNGKVSITAIPLGGPAVAVRNLYRTAAGGTSYLLVATIPGNETTFTDDVADAALGATMPTANTTGDPLLIGLIRAAREVVESTTHRALIAQVWRGTFDRFSSCDGRADSRDALSGWPLSEPSGWRGSLELRLVPDLLSVESIVYLDTNAAEQTLDVGEYDVDTDSFPGRVRLRFGKAWPPTAIYPNAVAVTMTRGFGPAASDVPSSIKAAMKLLIGHWYENRESVVVGSTVTILPVAVDALLAPYRWLAVEMA